MSRSLSITVSLCVVIVATTLAAASELKDGGAGPAAQCGWPALLDNGLFQPVTVRMAQHLLTHALDIDVPATGDWDAATIRATLAFRRTLKLEALPILDSLVWPALVKKGVPARYGDTNSAVFAIQEGLNANGYNVTVDGNFTQETADAVAAFRYSRNDVTVNESASVVVASTFHLLISECRAPGGVFWFDAGWPQGQMTSTVLQCLNQSGFQFATFECWVEEGPQGQFWSECPGNIKRAWEAGFQSVGVYMFAQRYYDPEPQARQLLGNLSLHNVTSSAIMLDVEGDKWNSYTVAENREFILTLRRVIEAAGMNITIYCGREWPQYFGHNFTAFSDVPLFYAHYDNVPSFYDFGPYGGWQRPAGKQFWDGSGGERICGTGELDWDWSPTPFWTE